MTWLTWPPRRIATRRRTRLLLVALCLTAARVSAQTPATPTPPAPTPAPYRAPTIVLAEPEPAGSVPADRPIVLFRFTAGEAIDPIDVSSFRVWVDGVERSTLFQIGAAEAWGPLAPMPPTAPPSSASDSLGRGVAVIRPGVHLVSARLCSTRGICGAVHAPVTVSPGADALAGARGSAITNLSGPAMSQASGDSAAAKPSKKRKVWSAVLAGARKLLAP